MGLDIRTSAGRKTLRQEREAKEFVEQHFDAKYLETNKDQAARIDAMLIRGDQIDAVAETKCRESTIGTFETSFRNEWLVTWEKIEVAMTMAVNLCVPLVGILYLVPSRIIMVKKICDLRWILTCKIRLEATRTQRTVNGGTVIRNNAYIDMSGVSRLKLPKQDE